MRRTILPFLLAGMAAFPVGSAFTAYAASKAKTYKGPSVDMRWGPVQAIVTIKSGKITKVKIITNPENRRSQFIDDQAVPMLVQETLQAQSANIDEITGATMTSDAYAQSLQSALDKAHFKAKS